MRSTRLAFVSAAFCSLLLSAAAQAATVSGTVTNKTTGKPSGGDKVELVDVQAGMAAVATATTNGSGHYSLNEPGAGPYLVRVTHQGAGYFIAAPEGGAPGDIGVYDAAAKVDGISIQDQIYEIQAQNGQLEVLQRYDVLNASSPKVTKAGGDTFEFVLPPDAVIDMAEATRPSGLPTMAQPKPTGEKGHYAFNVPIEPDQGDKYTNFQISYHVPYTGSYTFQPAVLMPTNNFGILLPKSMTFAPGAGANFRSIPQDPAIQTYLLRNAQPGAAVAFTVSGTGSMPREQQSGGADQGAQAAPANGQPGGGIGAPINTPDPLTKYKWWILGGLGLLLALAAGFLLRKPAVATAGAAAGAVPVGSPAAYNPGPAAAPVYSAPDTTPAAKNSALLNALKEELFALESEKLSGTIAANEYSEQKAALETVLKRALKRQ